jgi:hypothetical protein
MSGLPFSCCEASKDVACSTKKTFRFSLSDSKRPSLLITAPMEILCLPPISGSIIYPLKPSSRKLVSNEFEYHFPMVKSLKGLGCPKICLRVNFQIRDGQDWLRIRYFGDLLSFGFFRSRLWLRFTQQFLCLLEVSLRFREVLRKLFAFFVTFF